VLIFDPSACGLKLGAGGSIDHVPCPSEQISTFPELSAEPSKTVSSSSEQVTLERLNTQIDWYDKRSRSNKKWYKSLKTLTLIAATTIPVLTTSTMAHANQLAASLGVLITLLEALQQLNQYQANWIAYRATAESLKHEKYLFLGAAGIYAKSPKPPTLLAERVELSVSEENAKWLTSHVQAGTNDPSSPARVA
jgi:hypothetical protein